MEESSDCFDRTVALEYKLGGNSVTPEEEGKERKKERRKEKKKEGKKKRKKERKKERKERKKERGRGGTFQQHV